MIAQMLSMGERSAELGGHVSFSQNCGKLEWSNPELCELKFNPAERSNSMFFHDLLSVCGPVLGFLTKLFSDFRETRNSRNCSRVSRNFREFREFRKIKFLRFSCFAKVKIFTKLAKLD
jgi:hypothetical protein